MRKHTRVAAAALAAALLVPAAAGCASSGHPHAHAALSSLEADPTYQAQVQRLQAQLLANYQKDFTPAHPVDSMKQAVSETFPGASLNQIVGYAVKTFKLKDRKRGPDQDAWMHGVVTYALQQSAQGIPSGAASPTIPGVTSPAASKSS